MFSTSDDDYLTKGKPSSPDIIYQNPTPPSRKDSNSKDNLFLEGYGRAWGEKTTYSMGLSYGLCLATGGMFGMLKGMRKGGPTPKLFINSVMNGISAHGPILASQGAIMTMYYVLSNQLIQWGRGEDDQFNAPIAGGLSGFLYKATSGSWPVTARYTGVAAIAFTGLDQLMRKGHI